MFCKKKVFLEISQNSLENTYARVSFLINLQTKAWNFIKKEILAQVFSCEFCEISKNTFFYRTSLVAASVHLIIKVINSEWVKYGELENGWNMGLFSVKFYLIVML